MIPTLEEIKAYCRIDTDAEDGLLTTLREAAVGYLSAAGVDAPEDVDSRYNLCLMAKVLELYDVRGETSQVALHESPAFRALLNQLKLEAECRRIAEVQDAGE